MACVEDLACLGVRRVIRCPRLLVAPQGRLDFRREIGSEPVRLGDEVRERCGSVGEHQRPEPRRSREGVLLGEKAAPRLAEHVVTGAYPECIDEIVQLPHE